MKRILTITLMCLGYTSCLLSQTESLLIERGDEVRVQVLDTPEFDETARITDQGDLPLFGGSIHVLSLTPVQAARAIEAVFIEKQVMYKPQVLVTVQHYATQRAIVFGEVAHPGAYEIDTALAVVDVLSLAGGFTNLGDRHITIERSGGRHDAVFVANGPTPPGIPPVLVYPGDKVIVPKTGIVYILGDVVRPGGYPMNNNSSELTVLQAVSLAGGTANSAVASHTTLIRRTTDGGYNVIPFSFSAMQKGKSPDISLVPNDIIYVPFSYLRNAALGLTSIAAAATSAAIYTK